MELKEFTEIILFGKTLPVTNFWNRNNLLTINYEAQFPTFSWQTEKSTVQ